MGGRGGFSGGTKGAKEIASRSVYGVDGRVKNTYKTIQQGVFQQIGDKKNTRIRTTGTISEHVIGKQGTKMFDFKNNRSDGKSTTAKQEISKLSKMKEGERTIKISTDTARVKYVPTGKGSEISEPIQRDRISVVTQRNGKKK